MARRLRGKLSKLSPGKPSSVGYGVHKRGEGRPAGLLRQAVSRSDVGCRPQLTPVVLKYPVHSAKVETLLSVQRDMAPANACTPMIASMYLLRTVVVMVVGAFLLTVKKRDATSHDEE